MAIHPTCRWKGAGGEWGSAVQREPVAFAAGGLSGGCPRGFSAALIKPLVAACCALLSAQNCRCCCCCVRVLGDAYVHSERCAHRQAADWPHSQLCLLPTPHNTRQRTVVVSAGVTRAPSCVSRASPCLRRRGTVLPAGALMTSLGTSGHVSGGPHTCLCQAGSSSSSAHAQQPAPCASVPATQVLSLAAPLCKRNTGGGAAAGGEPGTWRAGGAEGRERLGAGENAPTLLLRLCSAMPPVAAGWF
jgi:hypothetical protein